MNNKNFLLAKNILDRLENLQVYHSFHDSSSFHNRKGKNGNMRYSPSSNFEFISVLNKLIEIYGIRTEDFHFTDYGCGKSGILVLARKLYNFEKVMGIEIEKDLCAISSQVISSFGLEDSVQCLNINAEDFHLFDDKNNFIYIYNSFVGDVFKSVFTQVSKSKSDVHILYKHPSWTTDECKFLLDSGFALKQRNTVLDLVEDAMASKYAKDAGITGINQRDNNLDHYYSYYVRELIK